MTPLRLQLLATPALVLPDGTHVELERKDAALLALLAVDGPLSRSRAAALMWPDAEAQGARNNLRQRLFRLRRAAGHDVVERYGALRLVDGIGHDLGDLATPLEHDPFAAAGELLGANDYGDCDALHEWVVRARAAFHSRRHDALAAAAAREERAGHIVRALSYAERIVAEDPLSEQGHRLVMRLHYRRGDRAAALAAHARCVAVLERELGTPPGAETHELAQLIERSDVLPGTASRPPHAAFARPPRLVGREAQWRAIDGALTRGATPVLVGDAGMGKSRLLGDWARSHGAGVVAARPGDARVPYAMLARTLRAALATMSSETTTIAVDPQARAELARLLPELGAAPAGPMQEARFRLAVAQALDAARSQGLAALVIDDLHYADAASIEILPALTGSLAFILAVRGAETPAALAAWLHDEGGATLCEVPLPPLGEADVRELIASLDLPGVDAAGLAAPLTRHTGGNPWFVLETLGTLVARPDGPGGKLPSAPTVTALIERRLAQLSPAALRLTRAAALAGPEFSAALAASVLESHPLDLTEAWQEATRAHVLRDDGFVHDLVQDVAAAGVPRPIAELLHAGIARYLEGSTASPARIAHHYAEGRRWRDAGRCHLRAAADARRASRRGEEVEQRELAATCFEQADDPTAAFEARRDAVEGLILVRGVEHARGVIDGLLAAARSDAQRAAALIARAQAALMAADHEAGVAAARAALALAATVETPWIRFDAARLLAVGLAQKGAVVEAEAAIAPFAVMVEAEGSAEQRGRYWADLAYVLNSARRLSRTADALDHAIDCAREVGDLAELATLTSNLATVHGNLGRVDRAYEHACRARTLQVELGSTDGPSRGVIEGHVGLYAAALGYYDTALTAFDEALACHRRDGQAVWVAVCSNNLAATLIDLGQFGRARRALAYVPPSVAHVAARGAMLAARLDRLLGGAPAANLERATAAMARSGDYYMAALIELERVRSLPANEVLVAADAAADAADAREYGGIAVKARLLAAEATLAGGDAPSALARWRDLQSLLATVQAADCYAPEAGAIGSAILLACGDPDAAATVRSRARRWIRDIALPHVPAPFADSFLHRNPVNRAVLAATSRYDPPS